MTSFTIMVSPDQNEFPKIGQIVLCEDPKSKTRYKHKLKGIENVRWYKEDDELIGIFLDCVGELLNIEENVYVLAEMKGNF